MPTADLTLTYTDEDGDVVTLVNDDDLHDMLSQRMNVFRINVCLNTENDGSSDTGSSRGSMPMRSSSNLFPSHDGNAGFAQVFKSVPEPLLEAFQKLSTDLASKTATSAPLLSEVLTTLSAMGESYFNPVSQSGVGADKSTQNRPSNDPPSNNPIDPSLNENSKASHADRKRDSTFKFNEAETTGPVSRGVGTSMTRGPATSVDLNFPSPPDVSGIPSFPDTSKIPTSSVVTESEAVPITVGSTSKVTATSHKETKRENDVALVVSNDLMDKRRETRKESEFAVGCSECASGGMKGTKKKVSAGHQGETFAGGDSSPWNAGCSVPYNPDPSHLILPRIPSDGQNYSASNFGNPFGDCPFTGMPLVNNSVMSTPSPHRSHQFKRSYKDAVGGRFHKNVQCDGCGVQPITGPRFKSKV